MDFSTKYENPSPRLTANSFSRLIFWWLRPLFQYGRHNNLEVKNLYNPMSSDSSEPLGNALEKNWKIEQDKARREERKPQLFTAIRKTFMWPYIHYGIGLLICETMRVMQTYTLGFLISFFTPFSKITYEEAYMYATSVILMEISGAWINHHINMGQLEMGMRLRIASSSLIYRKILKLSISAANKTADGLIINLLSNDVARFDQVFVYLHYIWIMPIQGAAIAYLIWQSVQIASLAGMFLITIQTIPLQGYLSRWTSKLRANVAIRTDERVRLMSEIITSVQVIKMYAWEKPFQKLVAFTRKNEIDILTITSYLRGFNHATSAFTERTTLFFTIIAYVLLGNTISADKVFSMARYFNCLQLTMTLYYPKAVAGASEASVTITRLQQFLLLDEKKPLPLEQSPNEKIGVEIEEMDARWDEATIANTLNDINVTIKYGTLCALVGPVGSGKSSLLQLILGELPGTRGRLAIGGKISYASQEPWLFTGTVRNNILFGQPYDELRYRRVIRACALLKDFIQLPQGDKTLVGERGTSLSGGQRARINLARAVYREADIYLFDDPLSAVDTHVGKNLFKGCLKEYLADKTRILVTHQVQYLKDVDYIVMLNNGAVEKQGTFEEFAKQDFKHLNETANEEEKEQPNEKMTAVSESNILEKQEIESPEVEEPMVKGEISKALLWKYFRAGNTYCGLFMLVLFSLLGQLGSSGCDYWVAYWTNQEELKLKSYGVHYLISHDRFVDNNHNELAENNHSMVLDLLDINSNHSVGEDRAEDYYYDKDTVLWIYGIVIGGCVIFTTARNIMFYKICMNACKYLHNLMFTSLLMAPMRFFDSNASGRILNRFSKDIGSVDELLPMTLLDSIQVFSVMVGILAQIIIIYWWSVFPIMAMGICYWKIRTIYLATAQDLKRLEGVTKSPVYSYVNASLAGLSTIRSARGQEMIRKEFDSHQDVHTGANSLLIATSTAFGVSLDTVTIVFIAFITYSSIIFKNDGTLAGDTGLVISLSLILCGLLQYGIRQCGEMLAQLTSVERVLQFTQLDKEGSFESNIYSKPPANWPTQGQIEFSHVYLKYSSEDPPVLKDLNFTIEPGMKVGIVGRTGAGKSSLINALFSLAKVEGTISIDNIDTKKIGLHDLRSKISIIPQEPMLFSATLRDNLDPFHQCKDAELWSALEEVELKNSCRSLDYVVTQGGTNFSAGQRQLLCLARAIVRNNKILVLDEATANIDPGTDALIQKKIRDKFKNCTVLTIAHRLTTIMDSDKILVMDHGEIMEFDAPGVLLQKSDGYLTSMVNETGPSMSSMLRRIAEEALYSVSHASV